MKTPDPAASGQQVPPASPAQYTAPPRRRQQFPEKRARSGRARPLFLLWHSRRCRMPPSACSMNLPARLDPEHQRAALPDWPRLMSAPLAAAYLSIGETTLRTQGPQPKRLGARVLWDRGDLDRWADALGGGPLDESQRAGEAGDILRRVQSRMQGLSGK